VATTLPFSGLDRLEPEYVQGKAIERSMPNAMHAWLAHLLSMRLHRAGYCLIDVRVRVADDVIRIPDLAVFREFPKEPVPSVQPLIVVEIVSPDDKHEELLRKLTEYRAWGVAHIWIVEPELKMLSVFDSRGLWQVPQFECGGMRVSAEELFAEPRVD
jgi:Uma2 family endonuclease